MIQKRKNLLTFVSWLVPSIMLFFFAWLDYRRALPPITFSIQVVVLLFFCGWGIWKVMLQRHCLPRSPLTWPLLVLLASTTIATFFSIDPRRSFDGLLITLALVLLFFVVGDMLLAGYNPQTFVTMMLSMTTLALVLGVWLTGMHYWSWWLMRVPEYPLFPLKYRLFDVIDHPNLLAAMLTITLPFAIMRLAQAQKKAARSFWSLWLVAFVVVLFFTRSRGGWLATSVVTCISICWLFFERGGLPWKTGLRAWVHSTWRIGTTTLFYVGLFVLLLMCDEMFAISTFTTNAGTSVGSGLSQRMRLWGVAWDVFLAHLLTGSGPLTYGYAFVQTLESVRYWVTYHPHSLFFAYLYAQGVMGVVALAWVFVAGAVAYVRGFVVGETCCLSKTVHARSLQDPRHDAHTCANQALLPCACAALSGYLVHGLVEVPGDVPTNDVLLIVVAGLGLHASGALRHATINLSRWAGVVFVVPLMVGAILFQYHTAQAAMLTGTLQALDGDWHAATQAVDEAVAHDPSFVFYYGQRGYAYGRLALPLTGEGDPSALANALASYRVALAEEPPYIPHMLNVAALLEQAGFSQQAERVVAEAVDQPQSIHWALPALLLADRYAQQGNHTESLQLFAVAFDNEPHAPEMAACRRSVGCRAATLHIPVEPDTIQLVHQEVAMLLQQGNPQEALVVLRRIPLGETNPIPWLDRAQAHLDLGQLRHAKYALRVASILHNNRLESDAGTYVARMRAAVRLKEGQPQEAIAALELVVRPNFTQEVYGYGMFRSVDFPGVLLLHLEMLQRTSEDLAVYHQLEHLYAAEGRLDDAAWAREQADVLARLLGL